MSYLYKHIRKDTSQVFYVGIGSDDDYNRAYTKHKRSLFWKSITKKTDYEIIIYEDNKTWDEIIELEKFWISFYGRRDLNEGSLVNLTNGGEGCYGRILSEDTKKKIGEKSKLKVYTEEYRKKLSESFKGEKNHRYGKKISEETKQKISKSQLGELHHFYGTKKSENTKQKIGNSQPTRKEICKCDFELNIIECYNSINSASEKNNISLGNLVTYLKKPLVTKQNKLRHLNGFVWKYKI